MINNFLYILSNIHLIIFIVLHNRYRSDSKINIVIIKIMSISNIKYYIDNGDLTMATNIILYHRLT